MSSHRSLSLATLVLVAGVVASACGAGDGAQAGGDRPGASAGVAVSPTTGSGPTGPGSASPSPTSSTTAGGRAGKTPGTTLPGTDASASATRAPVTPLPTTPVPTGKRPDPERPKQGQSFAVELVEAGRSYRGEVNLREVVVDRSPQDPALAGKQAILLRYTALNTGNRTLRRNDPVGDRFFVRSDDQVMGQQQLYGPDDPGAPGECRTAGVVEWRRGSVLTGCAVLTLPAEANLGGIAFFDGKRNNPRLRVLRYP